MMTRRTMPRELEHIAESKPASRTGRLKRVIDYLFVDGIMPYLWVALFFVCLVWLMLWINPFTHDMIVEQEAVMEEVFPDRLSCQVNTIVSESLALCYAHPNCNLGDEEMITLYIARKAALIDCKRADMIEAYILDLMREEADPII